MKGVAIAKEQPISADLFKSILGLPRPEQIEIIRQKWEDERRLHELLGMRTFK